MNSVNNATSSTSLASILQQIAAQTDPAALGDGSDAAGASDLADTLNLSGSSAADLEQQAEQIASENKSAALTTAEDAFAANLQAVAALGASSSSASTGQSAPDASTALSLM